MAGKQFDGRMIKDFTEFVKLYAATEAAAERRREAKKKDTIREMIEKIILRFKDGKIVLPAVPKVVQDIQRAMKDPDITTDKLAKVIERDAVISVRLITISNSATYRGTDKIQTVKQAVPRLGMKQAQSVVTAIASKGMYDVENEQFKEVLQKLWMHALATAYAARNLAVRVGLDDVEMLFLMGLVHDIGKVLLLKPLSELVDKAEVINMDEALTTI
ncbi:MAG: HDOD domain-containing protein, partial [bacterium]|nr:HDOD domain-containing protein [bacterium]